MCPVNKSVLCDILRIVSRWWKIYRFAVMFLEKLGQLKLDMELCNQMKCKGTCLQHNQIKLKK